MAQYHHGNLRAELIDLALAAAAEGGPEKLSVRELTRNAGVSPAAAYRHFPNQETLLREVQTRCRDQLLQAIRSSVTQHEPVGLHFADETRIRLLAESYITWAADHPGWYRTLFHHSPAGDDCSPRNEATWRVMAVLIGDALASSSDDERTGIEITTHAAAAALHGLTLTFVEGPVSAMEDDQSRTLIEIATIIITSAVHRYQDSEYLRDGSSSTGQTPLGPALGA